MGIRLNISENLAFGIRPEFGRLVAAPANISSEQVVPRQSAHANPTVRGFNGGSLLQEPSATAVITPANTPAAQFQEVRAVETDELQEGASTLAEANALADMGDIADGTPAPSIREFRFLTNPQSMQERELDARFNQLERRLEATNKRLQFADSVIERVDASLARARLEQDMDMIADQIRRMRLEQIFSKATQLSASPQIEELAAGSSQAVGDQRSAVENPVLNLLA